MTISPRPSVTFRPDIVTKHGIDKLDLMINFISCIETVNNTQTARQFKRFKAFLKDKLGREISEQEELNLAEGIVQYLQSEPETNERSAAMEYLFEAKFLID